MHKSLTSTQCQLLLSVVVYQCLLSTSADVGEANAKQLPCDEKENAKCRRYLAVSYKCSNLPIPIASRDTFRVVSRPSPLPADIPRES
ncbi:hypothetical protein EJ02DRAFT_179348 [Clathrospora elynae]|uniref:Uncharacterized protein n=1 Tax=Clathrospora elynae TaxID=706981 RepID=A0A6A5SNV2_9PLEO|nr:hypothetical protein EJ02DRAFT_179348 [Clathrospora elynae]